MSKTCPACSKPLFYAPYAPEDSAKMACSDLNCVNAHGIVQHLPVDRWERFPVESFQQIPPTKGHTMNDLEAAKKYISQREAAQTQIEVTLAPYLKDYIEFVAEINPTYHSEIDRDADTFVEIDHATFAYTGEEQYVCGDYHTPSVNLPFDFVEDPEAFKAKARQDKIDREMKAADKKKADAEERAERLRVQLAKVEAEIAKADEDKDAIRGLASRQRVKQVRDELANAEQSR